MTLRNVSVYRTYLMGIGIIAVLVLHSCFGRLADGTAVIRIFPKDIGYLGVDIFFLVSGFGIYFSLLKNSKPFPFYIRRFKKIYLKYLVVVIPYCIMCYAMNTIKWTGIIANIFSIQFWVGAGASFGWYTSALFAMYFIAPFYFAAISRSQNRRYITAISILCCVLGSLLLVILGKSKFCLFTLRAPSFLVGFLWASYSASGKELSCRSAYILVAVAGLAIIAIYILRRMLIPVGTLGLDMLCAMLTAPGLVLILCGILSRLKPQNPLMRFIHKSGKICFELYLANTLLMGIQDFILPFFDWDKYYTVYTVCYFLIQYAFALIFHYLWERAQKALTQR